MPIKHSQERAEFLAHIYYIAWKDLILKVNKEGVGWVCELGRVSESCCGGNWNLSSVQTMYLEACSGKILGA